MEEDLIIEVWDTFREYISDKNKEVAANQYVDFLVGKDVELSVLESLMGYDTYLDNAIQLVVDENKDDEEDIDAEESTVEHPRMEQTATQLMPSWLFTLLGWVPAVIFPTASALQLVTILRRKSSDGVSVPAWALFAIANMCLFVYTEKYGEIESIVGTLGTAGLNLCIVGAALKYRARGKGCRHSGSEAFGIRARDQIGTSLEAHPSKSGLNASVPS